MFVNGSHMYMDLNSGIGNFYIRDGTTTRFTFNDNGSLTCTGSVTASSFSGNATSATTASHADEPKRHTWSGSSTWKDVCAWTATSNTYEGIANATSGYVQISGNGKLRASGQIVADSFDGALQNDHARSAIASSNTGNKGTYAMLHWPNNNQNRSAGTTRSGSNLVYSNAGADDSGSPSGSWRLMGRLDNATSTKTKGTSVAPLRLINFMFTTQENGDFAFTNARRNVWGTIDCDVTIEETGEVIPFTATPDDSEDYGRALYEQLNTTYSSLVSVLKKNDTNSLQVWYAVTETSGLLSVIGHRTLMFLNPPVNFGLPIGKLCVTSQLNLDSLTTLPGQFHLPNQENDYSYPSNSFDLGNFLLC